MCDVVVTGMGMISALGQNLEENWRNIKEGKSGVAPIKGFDASECETQIAAEVTLNEASEDKCRKLYSKRECNKMTKNTRMCLLTADEALEQSQLLTSTVDKSRIAVIMGIISSNNSPLEGNAQANFIVKTMPNAASAWITLKYGFEGVNFNISSACASSAYAIVLAKQLLTSNMYDAVIVGGSDTSVEPAYINGFNQILAMSVNNASPQGACRPFDMTRDGFVMGEGAGALVLERKDFAIKRGAPMLCRLAGASFTSEATDITAPKKDGLGMAVTIQKAMEEAQVPIDKVDYINAHGTSTFLNDLYETRAIKAVFGPYAPTLHVSSTKSMIGHTLAACGAIEAIVTIKAITDSIVPPTINLTTPDDDLDLNYTPNHAAPRNIDWALSNSFGFGGHNTTLVFQKLS